MWVLLAILSALCLGFYDVSKKRALQQGDVLTVLAGSVCISALVLCVPLLLSRLSPEMMENTMFYVPKVGARGHLLIFAKSCIVLSSWVFAYISVKYLPLSVVSPMQATRPMWTLVGAMLIFGERLNGWQWAGVVCALGSIFLFSLTNKPHKEVRSKVYPDGIGSRTIRLILRSVESQRGYAVDEVNGDIVKAGVLRCFHSGFGLCGGVAPAYQSQHLIIKGLNTYR